MAATPKVPRSRPCSRASQKQVFDGAAHPFYWKPELRIPDIYEDEDNKHAFAQLLERALGNPGEDRRAAAAALYGPRSVRGAPLRATIAFVEERGDGPQYSDDPSFDAAPLGSGVPVSMAALDTLHGHFAVYQMGWDSAQLRAAVLVVMGRHDYPVPHVLGDGVLPPLRNVTYRLLERSGHTPQLEEPELFDRVLLDWLRDHAAEPSNREPEMTVASIASGTERTQ